MALHVTNRMYREVATVTEIRLEDTDSSNYLTFVYNEDASSDYYLYFLVGGGNRSITLNENFTIGDGYNVSITAEDAAGGITLDNCSIEAEDTVGSGNTFKLILGENASHSITLYEDLVVGDGNSGTVTFSGSSKTLTVEDTSVVNQDLTSDAKPTFAGVNLSATSDIADDVGINFGSDDDAYIEYDEAGDNTLALAIPSSGFSLRTAAADADNALLIKVAKLTVDTDDDMFDDSDTNDNQTVFTQPANSVLLSAKYVLDTQFSGGSVTDLDITIGLAGDPDGLVAPAAHNLTSDTVGTEYSTRGAYWSLASAAGYYASSSTAWQAYSTSVGDNVDQLTAGQVTFYFAYIDFQGT